MSPYSTSDADLATKFDGLPGAELVLSGIAELQAAEPTECSLLALIARPRLRREGVEIPARPDFPQPYEHALYSLLEQTHGDDAYGRYNSLLRRLNSFCHALEQRHG